MKVLRKVAALTFAIALATTMSIATAFAEDTTYSVTINNNKDGHTYEAYQIFKGDLSEGVLSNIEWGAGVSADGIEKLGDAAVKAASLEGESVAKAEAFAEEVGGYLTEPTAFANSLTDGAYVISGLPAGYYLVKDKEKSLEDKHDSYTTFILLVVGDASTNPKNAVAPSIDKQVHDEPADAELGVADGWGNSADHSYGESFQFRLEGTIPADSDYEAYEKFKVQFADTMTAGITFEQIDSVKVGGIEVSDYACTAVAGQAGGSWMLTIDDILLYDSDLTDGAIIEVLYSAHLNLNALIEGAGAQSNTALMKYSNNPNLSGEGFGETPGDSVWVFLYGVNNTKEDGEATPLAGAGFRLYADIDCANEIKMVYDETLGAYRPAIGTEEGEEMISAPETGNFDIIGLDAGTYYLSETTTPAGYNSCDLVTVELVAEHLNGETSLTLKINNEEAEKNVVVNQKGVTLPSTGGAGTTLFYALGAVLVISAGVTLVARRRSNNNE